MYPKPTPTTQDPREAALHRALCNGTGTAQHAEDLMLALAVREARGYREGEADRDTEHSEMIATAAALVLGSGALGLLLGLFAGWGIWG